MQSTFDPDMMLFPFPQREHCTGCGLPVSCETVAVTEARFGTVRMPRQDVFAALSLSVSVGERTVPVQPFCVLGFSFTLWHKRSEEEGVCRWRRLGVILLGGL